MAVTLKQVAKEAGVSIPTVHQILNGYTRTTFSDETRKRVMATAKALNYRPNITARSLVTQRSFLVGVLYNGINNHFLTPFMKGLQGSVLSHRCSPIFLTHRTAAEEAANLRSVLDRRVDGLIVNSAIDRDGSMNTEGVVAAEKAGLPVVEVFGLVVPGVPKLVLDYTASGRAMVERLVAEGHKRIALLIFDHFPENSDPHFAGFYWTASRFWQGYLSAMEAAGLEPILMKYSLAPVKGVEATNFRRVTLKLQEAFAEPKNAPTAVVCYSSNTAEPVIRFIESNRDLDKVHLAVAMANDSGTSESDRVAIHRFVYPFEEVGHAAGEALFARIAGQTVENRSFAPIIAAD